MGMTIKINECLTMSQLRSFCTVQNPSHSTNILLSVEQVKSIPPTPTYCCYYYYIVAQSCSAHTPRGNPSAPLPASTPPQTFPACRHEQNKTKRSAQVYGRLVGDDPNAAIDAPFAPGALKAPKLPLTNTNLATVHVHVACSRATIGNAVPPRRTTGKVAKRNNWGALRAL